MGWQAESSGLTEKQAEKKKKNKEAGGKKEKKRKKEKKELWKIKKKSDLDYLDQKKNAKNIQSEVEWLWSRHRDDI